MFAFGIDPLPAAQLDIVDEDIPKSAVRAFLVWFRLFKQKSILSVSSFPVIISIIGTILI